MRNDGATVALGRIRRLFAGACVLFLWAGIVVGATPHANASSPVTWVPFIAGASQAVTPLQNQGGPVQTHPQVYVLFWGSGWDNPGVAGGGDPDKEATYLINFLSTIGATPWLDTVNQYGAADPLNMFTGVNVWFKPGAVPGDPNEPGYGPNGTQANEQAQLAEQYFGVSGDNVQIIVALPSGSDPYTFKAQNTCGGHGVLSDGTTVTELPYGPDALQNPTNGCTSFEVGKNPLSITSVTEGHELAESLTDPELNGWNVPVAGSAPTEVGDLCNGFHLSTTVTGGGSFAVQPLWSNAASSANDQHGNCVLNYDHWSGWQGFTDTPALSVDASPAVASWAANRLDLFVQGSDGMTYQKSWNGTSWTGWASLGGSVQVHGAISAVSWAPDRIDLFGTDSRGYIMHRWWDGSAWSNWVAQIAPPPSGTGGVPVVASWGQSRLDVFVVGTTGSMYHAWWNGSWHSWENDGGSALGRLAAVSWGPSRIDVFATDNSNGDLLHQYWDGTGWSGWKSEIGHPSSGSAIGPAVASWGVGRLDVFTGSTRDQDLWHAWWDGSTWHYWQNRGGPAFTPLAAVSWLPYRIDIFAISPSNGDIIHMYYG